MGFFHYGCPPYLAAWASTVLPDATAVETGTFQGDSAAELADAFGRCITIERQPALAAAARTRFADDDRVDVLTGSSRDLLNEVLAGLAGPPFLWLDAHWDGDPLVGSDDPCPVLAEVAAVAEYFPGEAVVAVDDVRIFGLHHPESPLTRRWPQLGEVVAALEAAGLEIRMMDDVLVGVPPRLAASLSAVAPRTATNAMASMAHYDARWRARTSMRSRARRALGSGKRLIIAAARRARHAKPGGRWRFLAHANGVIHVGAHMGQEAALYESHELPVVWVEANPEVFQVLETNLADRPGQRAVRALVTDREGEDVTFFVASNAGGSSSILELGEHRDVWPQVHFVGGKQLTTTTLASLAASEGILGHPYDALVLDTQGSELLVLRGAGALLSHISWILVEVADFEAYTDCCQVDDIEGFLRPLGFVEIHRDLIADSGDGRHYFDILYQRAV